MLSSSSVGYRISASGRVKAFSSEVEGMALQSIGLGSAEEMVVVVVVGVEDALGCE